MRRLAPLLALAAVPGVARAEARLELAAIPELGLLQPVFPLDRYEEAWRRTRSGLVGSLALGYGRHDATDGPVATGTIALGLRTRRVLAAASSELFASGLAVVRGRHRGLLELRSAEDEEGIGGVIGVQAAVDHGDAPALAPVKRGPGRRDSADASAHALLHLGPPDDFAWVVAIEAEAGATRWHDTPVLDRSSRRALGLGAGLAPTDGELPRGMVDLVRGRVEHATIHRPIAAAGTIVPPTQVRTVELGLGASELTLHIDRELLAVIDAELGWSWLEADTGGGRLAENLFRMRLATAASWLAARGRGARRLGVAIAREPGHTADGQRLVSDWRVELDSALEDSKYVLGVRGGVSWLTSVAGAPGTSTLLRYGSHLEAFRKLTRGVELGVYHALGYEPQLAGDPWAAPRRWGVEAGVVARWRPARSFQRAPRVGCGLGR